MDPIKNTMPGYQQPTYEAQNQLLNQAEEIARMGHWEWNVVLNKITWSANLYRIYDIEQGLALSYDDYIEAIHPDDREMVQQHINDAMVNKKFTNYHHRIKLKDGTVKVMQSRGEVEVNEQGEVTRMMGTGQDVTEQKKAEQELLLKSRELEKMNAELQEFAYVASHDLQEPLRKLITFTHLLETDQGSAMSEKGRSYMDKIVRSSARMKQLIEDILQFSRLNFAIEFTPININEVIRQVLSDMEPVITASNAAITVNPIPMIEASATQMQQLFQNLISNALKFKKEAPLVTINAEMINAGKLPGIGGKDQNASNDKLCRISVTDNGIGIEEPYLESIFKIFTRLHGKQAYEGTGIGLAVCQKIVNNHHGHIYAESKVGEGTTFFVLLPLVQSMLPK